MTHCASNNAESFPKQSVGGGVSLLSQSIPTLLMPVVVCLQIGVHSCLFTSLFHNLHHRATVKFRHQSIHNTGDKIKLKISNKDHLHSAHSFRQGKPTERINRLHSILKAVQTELWICMVKIAPQRDISVVTHIKIFLGCKKKMKLELFILAECKWFPCKLFSTEKT